MNVAAVMDGLAGVLEAAGGLEVYAYPADQVSVPAGVVAYPELLSYDATMGHGGVDRADWPVHVVVSRASDRGARDLLAQYMAGSGVRSFAAAVDDDPTLGGAVATARVVSVAAGTLDLGGVTYVAATFTVDIIG